METRNTDVSKTKKFILAGMVASKDHYPVRFTSVQVQKMFFLLDKKIRSEENKPPYFNFKPYYFGPYDKKVYEELEELASENLVEIQQVRSYAGLRKTYNLTSEGVNLGKEVFSSCDEKIRQKIMSCVNRVLSHASFKDLVLDIYSEYPKMRVHSIFRS